MHCFSEVIQRALFQVHQMLIDREALPFRVVNIHNGSYNLITALDSRLSDKFFDVYSWGPP